MKKQGPLFTENGSHSDSESRVAEESTAPPFVLPSDFDYEGYKALSSTPVTAWGVASIGFFGAPTAVSFSLPAGMTLAIAYRI